MLQYVTDRLQQASSEPLGLLFALILGMYAVGFAIPLGAVMLGVSLGRVSLAARGTDAVVRWIAGLILIVVGFHFLITF